MSRVLQKLKLLIYNKAVIPWNVCRIKKKETIRVLFVLTELSNWKSERLYKKMLDHPRFDPVLGITPTKVDNTESYQKIIQYCKECGYKFLEIDKNKTFVQQTQADIILYSQPYYSIYYPLHQFSKNVKALIVYVAYYMHTILEEWTTNHPMLIYSWQYYFENTKLANEFARHMVNKGRNIVVTGIPIMDDFLDKSLVENNPWKNKEKKKRIIYAPHHTIGSEKIPDLSGINYSTFLEYGDFMLEMAEKYKDQVHFAFKPHPYLRRKLNTVWGKEKTDAYYKKWEEMQNTQLETGQYISLFHYSDAMIHDCASFTIEYLYAHKPVMYLVKDDKHTENGTQFMKDAFNTLYHGHSKQEIEQFIHDVINDLDPKKKDREGFFKGNLLPPGNKSACDNIIDAILAGL